MFYATMKVIVTENFMFIGILSELQDAVFIKAIM